jgi:PTS system N-acetylglucosamine-specific IIC component
MTVPPDIAAGFAAPVSDTLVAAWKAKELAKLSVPAGILAGLVSGWLYNRYATIRLPEYLAFFGGRRFVPIAAGCAGLIGAVLFGFGFPALEAGIDTLSRWVTGAGGFGLFLYGLLNRLLIVTGLHHILNNIAWFILGDYGTATGDINRFFAGDPSAGAFMSGFFPVMMFGLPAACLAMYRSAAPERRKAVGGMLLSLALTSFLTGVTEPIEFTFMFLAPVLYALHAVLTGIAMVVMDALGVKLGFGFSAGLFDYLVNYGLATRPLMLLPVGAAYFAIYYATFRFCIVRFNLKTPGRDMETQEASLAPAMQGKPQAAAFVEALGGAGNLVSVDACTTRLRLILTDPDLADASRLKQLGARGVIKPGGGAVQVVLGPLADAIASDMRDAVRLPTSAPLDPAILAALGGPSNVRASGVSAGRWRVQLENADLVEHRLLDAAAPMGWSFPGPRVIHILRSS